MYDWRPHAPAQQTVAIRAPQAWLQVTRGSARVNGLEQTAGDGLAPCTEPHLQVEVDAAAELLLIELP